MTLLILHFTLSSFLVTILCEKKKSIKTKVREVKLNIRSSDFLLMCNLLTYFLLTPQRVMRRSLLNELNQPPYRETDPPTPSNLFLSKILSLAASHSKQYVTRYEYYTHRMEEWFLLISLVLQKRLGLYAHLSVHTIDRETRL